MKATRVLAGGSLDVPVRFVNGSQTEFYTEKYDMPEAQATLGAGLNVETINGVLVFGDYDYTFGDGSEDHQLRGGVRLSF